MEPSLTDLEIFRIIEASLPPLTLTTDIILPADREIANAQLSKALWWCAKVLSDQFISTDDPRDTNELFFGNLSTWLEYAGIKRWEDD